MIDRLLRLIERVQRGSGEEEAYDAHWTDKVDKKAAKLNKTAVILFPFLKNNIFITYKV